MIVLDASVVVELLLATTRGAAVRARNAPPEESLHAPHLLDVEVAQVLRRYPLAGDLGTERARQARTDLVDLPVVRYPPDVLLPRVGALRRSVTAYDAVYVALGEGLGAPLLTCDRRLAAAPGHRARVEILDR